MKPTRTVLMLVLCLAVLGPVWPKAFLKAMSHPTEGVVAQDDGCDADDSLPGILPVAATLGAVPLARAAVPVEPVRITIGQRQTLGGPRAPPPSPSA